MKVLGNFYISEIFDEGKIIVFILWVIHFVNFSLIPSHFAIFPVEVNSPVKQIDYFNGFCNKYESIAMNIAALDYALVFFDELIEICKWNFPFIKLFIFYFQFYYKYYLKFNFIKSIDYFNYPLILPVNFMFYF